MKSFAEKMAAGGVKLLSFVAEEKSRWSELCTCHGICVWYMA